MSFRLTIIVRAARVDALRDRAAGAAPLLWYDKPATDWEKEALPIGNGRIGAMVFGGVASERLQISEKVVVDRRARAPRVATTMACRPSRRSAVMSTIGKQLLDGATLEPEDVAKQLGRKMHNYGDYQSFGDLIIETAGGEGESPTIAASSIWMRAWRA